MGIGYYGSRGHNKAVWGDKCTLTDENTEGESGLCFGYNGASPRETIQRNLRAIFTEEGSKKLLEFIEVHFKPGG